MTYTVTALQNHEAPAAPPLDDIDTAEDIANCYGFYSAPPVRLDLLEAFAERFGLRIEVEGDPDGPNRRSIAIADGPVTGSISAAGEELRVSLLYKNVHVEVPLMIDGQPINAFHERVDADNAPAIYAALGAMMAEKLVQREGERLEALTYARCRKPGDMGELSLAFMLLSGATMLPPEEWRAACAANPDTPLAELLCAPLPVPVTQIVASGASYLAQRRCHWITPDGKPSPDPAPDVAPTTPCCARTWRELVIAAGIQGRAMRRFADCWPDAIKLDGATASIGWGT